ncbi:transposase [Algoriphagus mannitolivorans]|uniref:transposase n=1 Tax=Algoriphagus mannitolivorans TaxID=226504 RepID=UPI000479B0D5|nr:transposase [Algoriphagus mannitolivorans]
MELEKVYFFTATIKEWNTLLEKDVFKRIVLESLQFLSSKKLIKVYGFVIMPNHIHLIWEMLELNGKESPHTSFLKYTAHKFLKTLKEKDPTYLKFFEVNEQNKAHLFWQRNSLPIEIYSPKVIFQKLEYIHNNPCRGKWMLSESPDLYPFSSYEFYETGRDRFNFLNHIGERI